MQRTPLPGFRDFYPTELAERSWIFARWREVVGRYGFVEYDGPPLEPLDLYTTKSGDEIVAQLYAFEDKGGRSVALRPEMTPTLARMVAARANAIRKPVRWFSIPQLFRYERQQRGRLREHFQLNVDIIGEADVTADAELLALAVDVIHSFGLTPADVRARVSDRRLLQTLLGTVGVPDDALGAVYAVVDRIGREPRESLERKLRDAGLSDSSAEGIFALLRVHEPAELRARYGGRENVDEAIARMLRYHELLEALGVREWVDFDLSIVRGLAYYTGLVFELFDARGELRAICGGGRYDNLLAGLGGVDLPALGFGMGDVVLGELLRARGLMPAVESGVDVWVAYADGAFLEALRVATQLRARGLRVEYALGGQQLSRQMKSAHATGARHALVVGGAGVPPGEAVVRHMSEGREERVSLRDWIVQQGG